MDLIKPAEPLEFKHEDMSFLIRPHASEGDRMEVTMSGSYRDGAFVFSRPEFNRALVRRFVVGWKGVKMDGKEVPYAFDLLDHHFPISGKDNIFVLLGIFIVEKTGIFAKDDLIKNDSREPAIGPSK